MSLHRHRQVRDELPPSQLFSKEFWNRPLTKDHAEWCRSKKARLGFYPATQGWPICLGRGAGRYWENPRFVAEICAL